MFTIKRSGALALFLTALLTQNAQVQAFSFASVHNALKNNPGKTLAAVLSAAVAGYGLYKWLSPPPPPSAEQILKVTDNGDGNFCLMVKTILRSKSFFGKKMTVTNIATGTYSYDDLKKHVLKNHGINK